MNKAVHVAVLGAGIMGVSTALFLARRGVHVTIFDAAHAPFTGASRWNEGKIHLGFLYAADPSLRTLHRLLPGGLEFRSLVEELTGCALDRMVTPADDNYLVHRESVTDAPAMERYFRKIADIIKTAPGAGRYLTDLSDCGIRPLTQNELESIADTRMVVAGYRVPERSVSTHWLADRYIEALDAESRVDTLMETPVTGARPKEAGIAGPWMVEAGSDNHGPYDFVVNALWEGRLAVDSTAGLRPAADWSHRFRLCLFVRTARVVDIPSVVIATGPFGDVKNYTGRDFYLSWYPAGLVAEGNDLAPPEPPDLDDASRARLQASIWEHLGELVPPIRSVASEAETVHLAGGWVFAMGRGSLSDRRSTLHRRDHIEIRRRGSYISVDTGKYSIAPWLAREVADLIAGSGI